MTSSSCNCNIPRFPSVPVEGTISGICRELGFSSRQKDGFYADVQNFVTHFMFIDDLRGSELINWTNPAHQCYLTTLAHTFLCTKLRGPHYWPLIDLTEYSDRYDFTRNFPE